MCTATQPKLLWKNLVQGENQTDVNDFRNSVRTKPRRRYKGGQFMSAFPPARGKVLNRCLSKQVPKASEAPNSPKRDMNIFSLITRGAFPEGPVLESVNGMIVL